MVRFPLALVAAHLPVLFASGWIIRRGWRPTRLGRSTRRWMLALLADGVVFCTAAALGLVVLSEWPEVFAYPATEVTATKSTNAQGAPACAD